MVTVLILTVLVFAMFMSVWGIWLSNKECGNVFTIPDWQMVRRHINNSNESMNNKEENMDPINDRENDLYIKTPYHKFAEDSMSEVTKQMWNSESSHARLKDNDRVYEDLMASEMVTPEYLNRESAQLNELYKLAGKKSRMLNFAIEKPANDENPWSG